MNYIDWDHPLLEGQTLIQNLVREGLVQAGTKGEALLLTTHYISTFSLGSTWDAALVDLFRMLEGEFEELVNSRKGW